MHACRTVLAIGGGEAIFRSICTSLFKKGRFHIPIVAFLVLNIQSNLHFTQICFGIVKPRTIIEIGSKAGGAALWLADQLRTFGIEGRVLSIDIKPPSPPFERPDIQFLHGDANRLIELLSESFLKSIPRPLLVIEDASHHYEATLAVLRFFHPFLRKGEYIVVEDANVSDMGDDSQRAGGPGRAISEFLLETGEHYEIDVRYCDRYGHNVTGNPNGYLKRVDR